MTAPRRDPGAGVWADRERACGFGADPESYDRLRPGYPPGLVDELTAGRPRSVLDVGCGTGKAGRLLADRGCRVLGVEPDGRMAAVARRHGLEVEQASFEDWDPVGRRFDLVISAQAWHWVDPERGLDRVVQVLRPGGRFAAFWNQNRLGADVAPRMKQLYADLAPSLQGSTVILGVRPRLLYHAHLDAVREHPGLGAPEERSYAWPQPYDRERYEQLLLTHSDHRRLPEAARRRLLDAIGALVDGAGGTITVRYETYLITAAAP